MSLRRTGCCSLARRCCRRQGAHLIRRLGDEPPPEASADAELSDHGRDFEAQPIVGNPISTRRCRLDARAITLVNKPDYTKQTQPRIMNRSGCHPTWRAPCRLADDLKRPDTTLKFHYWTGSRAETADENMDRIEKLMRLANEKNSIR